MTPQQIEEFYRRLAQNGPAPQTELRYTNPYTLLVAVVLSAQATDVGVNRATAALFDKVSDPQQMLELGEDRLRDAIRTIGLYQTKAKNVIALSKILVEKHQGQVPPHREDLEALPGVGRKTANVVLNVAFGEPTIAVDTHIFRVGNRTGLAIGDSVREVEDALLRVTPPHWQMDAHHHLILFGRYICKAINPSCDSCPVSDLCANRQNRTSEG